MRMVLIGALCGVTMTIITGYTVFDWQWWILTVPPIALLVVTVWRMRL